MKYLAQCSYVQTAPSFAMDRHGISWTKDKREAYRFPQKGTAASVAVAHARASKGAGYPLPVKK